VRLTERLRGVQKPPEIQAASRFRAHRTTLKLTQEEPAAELEKIAREPGALEELRLAHARALERFLAPARRARSFDDRGGRDADHHALGEGEGRRELQGGFGFHPLQAYADETREALGGVLRAGNAGSNTVDGVCVCVWKLEAVLLNSGGTAIGWRSGRTTWRRWLIVFAPVLVLVG
jgi:hypothetical protein